MCRENEGSDTVFRQYRMGAIDKAVDDRHAERRVAKNDGYVLLRQLDASEVSDDDLRSEEHTSELQSLMRISYAVFCLKKKNSNHVRILTYKTHDRSIKQKYYT